MDIEHTWSPNIKADTKPVDKVIYSIPAKSSVKTTIVLNEVPVFVSKKD